jgi:hypothetical protein
VEKSPFDPQLDADQERECYPPKADVSATMFFLLFSGLQ